MNSFKREKISCAYFFAVPGLTYGIFTARLPYLKKMVGADDTMVGILLLILGAASFAGLVSSRRLVVRYGTKRLLMFSGILMCIFLVMATMAPNYWVLAFFCMLAGCVEGVCEVVMNTQGMSIEARYNKMCMSSLHACFSLGGLIGSLSGALFAYFNLSAAANFLFVCALYLAAMPKAVRHLVNTGQKAADVPRKERAKIPVFIYLCGLTSMLCYISEGAVGEWGSILLHSEKGASQDQAALVFGCFCSAMVLFRLIGDRVRQIFSDRLIACGGSLGGAFCMATVLLSSSPLTCLAAYTVMGACFAQIVPILFSRAGKTEGISPARASSAISIMSYTGLLVFPPLLGMLGDGIGLERALWVIVAACICICCNSWFLFRKNPVQKC